MSLNLLYFGNVYSCKPAKDKNMPGIEKLVDGCAKANQNNAILHITKTETGSNNHLDVHNG